MEAAEGAWKQLKEGLEAIRRGWEAARGRVWKLLGEGLDAVQGVVGSS